MHLCRTAWQKLAPLASGRGIISLFRNGPVRQMSSTSVPGSSGSALPYYLLTGVAVTGGGIYVYRTLARDRARFQDRHSYIDSRQKADLVPRSQVLNLLVPEPPECFSQSLKGLPVEISVVSETVEEKVESVTVEVVATEVVVDQQTGDQPVVGEGASLPTEQELRTGSEAAPAPEESTESIEAVTDASPAPVLEAQTDNIQEELASAAEDDWSELSARKPEEVLEETSLAKEEIDENVESKEAAASS
ncbi:protein MGARP [Spea bombifrons]|uniref:protein MGARP n=1 Tax=Spea bombifrons TaxID=233779 RepID=UPI0023499F66|nr:protein MGARP [Spea bombifrons]